MAIQQVLGTDKALRLNDFTLLGLVQNNEWSPEFAAQQVNEMGNDARVDVSFEMEARGQFELMSQGNTAGLLARMQVARDAGSKFTGYTYAPGTSKNAYTFTQTSLKEMQFDLVVHEKPDQATFSRSVWIPRAFLTNFSGRIDATGMATETYQWQGQMAESFVSPFHDIRSLACTVHDNATLYPIDATVNGASHTLAYVLVDDRIFTAKVSDATHFTIDAVTGYIACTSTEGYVIPATATASALVYKTTTPSTAFPTLLGSDRGTSAFSMRGYQANVYVAPANAASPQDSEKWLKVQSMSWDVNLRVETLRQIQKNPATGSTVYARVPTFPIEISLNLTTNETDWADWKALMTKSFTGTAVYDNSYSFAPTAMKQNFNIVVEYFTKDGATKLQSWRFTDCYIDGVGKRVAVGGRSEVTWQAKATAFALVGFDG